MAIRRQPAAIVGHNLIILIGRSWFSGHDFINRRTASDRNKIVEELGLDDGVTALTQLGLLKAA